MGIFDNILNPGKALADLANSVIKDFVADPTKKVEFAEQVAVQQAALETATLEASKSAILAEEQGELWIQKGWRPIVSLGLFFCILYAGPIVSIFHFPQMSMAGVPSELWSTFRLCVGGYMGLRSVEKGVDMYTSRGKNSDS